MNIFAKFIMKLRYRDTDIEVALGDKIKLRRWFIWRPGVITYLPGVSPKHKNMEFNGLAWLGVQLVSGLFVGLYIDNEPRSLTRRLKFVARGESADLVKPNDRLFEDDEDD